MIWPNPEWSEFLSTCRHSLSPLPSLAKGGRVKNMMNTRSRRWLRLFAWLLVLAIIVMLFIPSELTESQLAQIKPGMSLEQVQRLLGEPAREWEHGAGYGPPGHVVRMVFTSNGKWAESNLSVTIDADADTPHSMQNTKWTGANHLLWVEYDDKKLVTKTWLFPIARSGGGFQGCIDTMKECLNSCWK